MRHAGFALAGWLAVTGALAAGCGAARHRAAASRAAPTSYATLLVAGNRLLTGGDEHAAARLYEQAIVRQPDSPVGYYDLGVAYQRIGDRRDAARQYTRALAHDRSYTPALYNEAVLVSARNPQLAIFLYRQVISFKSDSPTAWLNLGLLEVSRRRLLGAGVRDLRRALVLDPALSGSIPKAELTTVRRYRGPIPPLAVATTTGSES